MSERCAKAITLLSLGIETAVKDWAARELQSRNVTSVASLTRQRLRPTAAEGAPVRAMTPLVLDVCGSTARIETEPLRTRMW